MIHPEPTWTYAAQQSLRQWYSRVHLLPEHVAGPWFCLGRQTGKPIWQSRFGRPNNLRGISDGVMIATQTVPKGLMGTSDEACYGISLLTGAVLWALEGEDAADSVSTIDGDEVIFAGGRVVSVQNGRMLRQITREEVQTRELNRFYGPLSAAEVLYGRRAGRGHERARIDGVGWLTHLYGGRRWGCEEFRLFAVDDADELLWRFDLASTGYVMNHYNFFAYRLAGRYVYVIAAEGSNRRRLPPPGYEEPIPTTFHLLALELQRGTVIQDILVTDAPVADCQIEVVDDQALVISTDRRRLLCFSRVITPTQSSPAASS